MLGQPEADRELLLATIPAPDTPRMGHYIFASEDIRVRGDAQAEEARANSIEAARERMAIREEFGIPGAMGNLLPPGQPTIDLTDDNPDLTPEDGAGGGGNPDNGPGDEPIEVSPVIRYNTNPTKIDKHYDYLLLGATSPASSSPGASQPSSSTDPPRRFRSLSAEPRS